MPPSPIETSAGFSRDTQVIAVLDVVESVRLMEQDQAGFVQRWHDFVEHVRKHLLPAHGGRMLKSLGDGLMLSFNDATGCVKAAFALHDLSKASHDSLPPDQRMHLRVGAHLAEFVADEHDIYGTDVNLTARVATLAGPGETIITAGLRDRLTAGLDADIEDLGECHLKHVNQPIRAYRVGPAGHAPVLERGAGMQLELRPSIAVVPFAMRSAEPGHDMLGEAIADEVIAALSRTSELHVISRLSTTVFRERHHAVDDIRTHLGASYILSGTCRCIGSQLALFVELIDAKSGHIVWAGNLKGEVTGIFASDDALIASLVASISASVMSHQMQRARSHALPTLEGYSLLLGAVTLMHRNALSDFDRARVLLEHLIERSRRHPIPHAWLAKWHVLRVQQGWSDDPAQEARRALDATQRALDNEPDCALALTVDGLVRTNLLHDTDNALLRYQQAIDQNPNESLAWLLKGTMHAFRGDGDEAVSNTTRALALSPLDPLRYFYYSLAATAALSAGQYERALTLARESLRANRTHTSTWRVMAISQVHLGQMADARASATELLRLQPGLTVSNYLSRHPSGQYGTGRLWADALRQAGVPL